MNAWHVKITNVYAKQESVFLLFGFQSQEMSLCLSLINPWRYLPLKECNVLILHQHGTERKYFYHTSIKSKPVSPKKQTRTIASLPRNI